MCMCMYICICMQLYSMRMQQLYKYRHTAPSPKAPHTHTHHHNFTTRHRQTTHYWRVYNNGCLLRHHALSSRSALKQAWSAHEIVEELRCRIAVKGGLRRSSRCACVGAAPPGLPIVPCDE